MVHISLHKSKKTNLAVLLVILLVSIPASYAALSNGLVFCVSMDNVDITGNQITELANNQVGNLTSITTGATIPGRIGQSLSYDGINSVLTFGDSPFLDTVGQNGTVLVWLSHNFSAENSLDEMHIIEKGNVAGGGASVLGMHLIQIFTDVILESITFFLGGQPVNSFANQPTTNTIVLVGASWNASVVNGIFNGSEADFRQNDVVHEQNDASLLIGDWVSSFGPFDNFKGIIDQTAIWNRKLTPSEVAEYYDNGDGKSCRDMLSLATPTPTGTNVTSDLSSSVSILFSNVTSSGSTNATVITSPAPQAQFLANGSYYNITSTATFSGNITVYLPYDPVTVTDPNSLRLYHFESGSWVDVTTGVDTATHRVFGVVSSLSPFAIGTPLAPTINFIGFLQPVNNDGSSIFKLGSTVPIKFQLTDSNGNFVANAVAKIFLAKVSDGVAGSEVEAISTNAPDSGNTFRISDNQYIFNLNTKGFTTGTWQIRVTVDIDGSSHNAQVSLK